VKKNEHKTCVCRVAVTKDDDNDDKIPVLPTNNIYRLIASLWGWLSTVSSVNTWRNWHFLWIFLHFFRSCTCTNVWGSGIIQRRNFVWSTYSFCV